MLNSRQLEWPRTISSRRIFISHSNENMPVTSVISEDIFWWRTRTESGTTVAYKSVELYARKTPERIPDYYARTTATVKWWYHTSIPYLILGRYDTEATCFLKSNGKTVHLNRFPQAGKTTTKWSSWRSQCVGMIISAEPVTVARPTTEDRNWIC